MCSLSVYGQGFEFSVRADVHGHVIGQIFFCITELSVGKSLDDSRCFFGNGVKRNAAIDADDRLFSAARDRSDHRAGHTSLFQIDHGIGRIGGKYVRRKGFLCAIVSKVGGAAFFIRTDDHTDIMRKMISAFLECAHSKENGNSGSLIVRSTSAVQLASAEGQCIGGIFPARSFGNDVQMAKYTEFRVSLGIHINRSDVIFMVGNGKTVFFRHTQHFGKNVCVLFAVRHIVKRSSFNAGDRNKGGQTVDHFTCVIVYILIDFRRHHLDHHSFQSFTNIIRLHF